MADVVVVYVRWFDSLIYMHDRFRPEDFCEFAEMESSGFLICENDKSVSIALDRSLGSGALRLGLCIPRVNIRSIQYFRPKEAE